MIIRLNNVELQSLQKVVDCAREHATLIQVEFTCRNSTGIGTNIYVTTYCEEVEHNQTFDITDYSSW